MEFEVPENEKVEIEVISPGDPEAAPAAAGQEVEMAYEGRLLDGSVFDSSKSFKFELGAGEVCLRALPVVGAAAVRNSSFAYSLCRNR